MHACSAPSDAPFYVFDARAVAKRFRHAAIFGALESLHSGETMRFINDHDPLPLLSQLRERYRDQLDVQYVQRDAEAVMIDFTVQPHKHEDVAAVSGGCGGQGCGCSGR